MSEKAKDALKVTVSVQIVGKEGYSEVTIHNATLTTTGPLDVPTAIEEARSLASACVRSTREAHARAEIEKAKAALPEGVKAEDPNTIF